MFALAINNLFSNIKGESSSTALGIVSSGTMMRSYPLPAEYSRLLPDVSRQNFKIGYAEIPLGKKIFCDIVFFREIPFSKTQELVNSQPASLGQVFTRSSYNNQPTSTIDLRTEFLITDTERRKQW